ncbi:MAG: TIGR04376 family protein [Cyanobacteria bacterium P01_D01_bin.123]
MNLIEDLIRFLETRLEEFLRSHPELELQALEEQLHQQETDTSRLISQSRSEQQRLQSSILSTAQEIKTWHQRIDRAVAANRPDLAQGARDREASLLQQGNLLWGQMEGAKTRIQEMEKLLQQIKTRRQEVQERINTSADTRSRSTASTPPPSSSWSSSSNQSAKSDDLEKQFSDLETELELQALKRRQQSR